ncbi:ATP-dependent DNA helicase UvrD2 [Actinomyces vulturis]|uniref:ATP-dependent DNA helicase UvrD2 n=1 Tax=Actinomyces vulturis TaxID=1857645 RepID=UPI000837498C|nr:ATP-dependent DNA helicase UvrD2 [Actinomyces vulturis]
MNNPARSIPAPEQLLAALDPDQRQVAEHVKGPLCVLAGAGTGKTRAITYRIAYGAATGLYDPAQVLAVTFTSRAAHEMRSRLADLGVDRVQARTFHSAALRQLQYFWPTAVGGQCPRIEEQKISLVAQAARRLGVSTDRATLRDLAGEIEWAKVTMTLPEHYARAAIEHGRSGVAGVESSTVASLMSCYEDVKSERGTIDFDDVLLILVGILGEREDIADQIRRQYKHFVVDEYQDVSPLQQRLLDLWLGRRRTLCVVGDVSQTIYSFSGATPAFLSGFSQRYKDATTVSLTKNYRSTPQVVWLANTVLTGRGPRARSMPAGAVTLISQQSSGPAVTYSTYDDDEAEAQGVVERIRELAGSGVPLREIAVLYRTNAQSEVFEQALAEAGVGYTVRGGERFFQRQEVKRAMVLLRAASKADLTGDLGRDVRDVLSHEGWSEEPPAARGAQRERWDTLNALVELADHLAGTRGADMAVFLQDLSERAQNQHAPSVDGVTLASLHAAKGLEWDAVFLAGMSEGLLPISLAEGKEAIEEERRLLYVGVTRARKYLNISYAKARNAGGRASRRYTRFLQGIWPSDEEQRQAFKKDKRHHVGQSTTATQGSRRAQSKAMQEEFVANNDEKTVELFEHLRKWRSRVAVSLSKPAFFVFSDVTLRDIAIHKPTTMDEVLSVRGIGSVKAEKFGPGVIEAVNAFLNGDIDDESDDSGATSV